MSPGDPGQTYTHYRPFLEYTDTLAWQNGVTNLKRQQILKVYAKPGETIYLASSVYDSAFIDNTGEKDIQLTEPDGTIHYYDVKKGSDSDRGFIENRSKELAGPQQLGNSSGYLSYEYPVTVEGVYEIRFYPSEKGDTKPNMRTVGGWVHYNNAPSNNINDEKSAVAAWDVTVAAPDPSDSNKMKAINGRLFADYLTMWVGGNRGDREVVKGVVYVVTADGYIYMTDFNGMDPDGFLFFANNTGLLDKTTGLRMNHSTMYTDNYMTQLRGDISFFLPTETDPTGKNQNYRIFFNLPDDDALKYFGTDTALPPAEIKYFSFNAGKYAAIGAGGDFTFECARMCSYTITVTFGSDDTRTVTLSGVTSSGANTVHWDGKDAKGNVVNAGEYTASIKTVGGEYHFPIADVEQNKNGFIVQLCNVPAFADADFKPDLLYYDHSNFTSGGESIPFTPETDNTSPFFTGSLTRLDGVPSMTSPASAFTGSANSGFGNLALLDLWTYFSAKAFVWNTPVLIADTGSLKLNKTVTGAAGETTRSFVFTLHLSTAAGKALSGKFPYGGGTIGDGDTVSLKHGESITITGLPVGTRYSFTEQSYASIYYTTTYTGDTGTIVKDTTVTADFYNNRDAAPKPPKTGDSTPLLAWTVLLLLSAIGGLALIRAASASKR